MADSPLFLQKLHEFHRIINDDVSLLHFDEAFFFEIAHNPVYRLPRRADGNGDLRVCEGDSQDEPRAFGYADTSTEEKESTDKSLRNLRIFDISKSLQNKYKKACKFLCEQLG